MSASFQADKGEEETKTEEQRAYFDPLTEQQKALRDYLGPYLQQQLTSPTALPSSLYAPSRDILTTQAEGLKQQAAGQAGLPAGALEATYQGIDESFLAGLSNIIGQAETRTYEGQQQTIQNILAYLGLGTPQLVSGVETEQVSDWEKMAGSLAGSYGGGGGGSKTSGEGFD
jgi:hypothetical protein